MSGRDYFISQVAQNYADDSELLFLQTSAKTGENIDETFNSIGLCFLWSFYIVFVSPMT